MKKADFQALLIELRERKGKPLDYLPRLTKEQKTLASAAFQKGIDDDLMEHRARNKKSAPYPGGGLV